MIQRIQTLYLLLAELLLGSLFFTKLVEFFTSDKNTLVLKFNGIYRAVENGEVRDVSAWPLAVLLAAAAFIGFVVIFLYRHRLFQIRLCFFNMALSLGVFILIAYYTYSVSVVADIDVNFSIVDVFPIVAIILYYLAYRGIAKDEAMVVASSFRSRRR